MNLKNILSFSMVLLAVGVSSPAFAQSGECTVDADCPDGFTCQTDVMDVCAPCAEGTECEPCETTSRSYCVPPPPKACESDASCDGDDVCVTYTFETCSGGAAPPICEEGTDCTEPDTTNETEACTTESESYCVPPYVAPCSADADCGAGFTCEDVEMCSCSGSSGGTEAPPRDGETGSEPAPTDDCSCEPTGEKYCQLIETPCTSDADCSADLVCMEYSDGGQVDEACVQEPCPESEPVAPESFCAPADFYWGGGFGYDEAVAEASGNSDAEVTGAEREEFFPVDGDDGSTGGSKGKPSACATGLGAQPAGSALVLLFGLALARIRRRR